MEEVALPRATVDVVINFMFELIVQYGLPQELVIDGRSQFTAHKISSTLKNYHIKHKLTSPYHPQANG